ncbi:MAG: hypothetical protein AMXMBFR6_15850 [Betaproteobacteria bacterium]
MREVLRRKKIEHITLVGDGITHPTYQPEACDQAGGEPVLRASHGHKGNGAMKLKR